MEGGQASATVGAQDEPPLRAPRAIVPDARAGAQTFPVRRQPGGRRQTLAAQLSPSQQSAFAPQRSPSRRQAASGGGGLHTSWPAALGPQVPAQHSLDTVQLIPRGRQGCGAQNPLTLSLATSWPGSQ